MKQSSKNETEILNLINKIQEQLTALDNKLNILVNRTQAPAKPPSPVQPPTKAERVTYKAICADCNKECSIPFKPSGDRPIYCQECFSRRKVIRLSGIKGYDKPKEAAVIPEPKVNIKKKAVSAKKPAAKKKPVPKKK